MCTNNENKYEEIKAIFENYVYDNYHDVDLKKKELVLKYILMAMNKQLDESFTEFIIKTFISNKATLNDFDENKLKYALSVIYYYVDSNFSVVSAIKLNALTTSFKPQIDFSGMRYEGFDPMFDDFKKEKEARVKE